MAFISKKSSKNLLENMVKKNNDKIIEDNFTAQDGTQFKFGITEDGKYGYIVKDKDGADSVIPFNKQKTTGISIVLPTNPDITIEPNENSIKIIWNAPESEVEIDHYNIYYSNNRPSSLKDMTKVGETKELEYTINGLTVNNTYYIGVQSADINNNENASIWKIKNGITSKQIVFICVGNSGSSYYSTDGLTWNTMSGLDSSKEYSSVIYGNDRFVCVGSNGYSYYSTDGLTWTAMNGLDSSIYIYRSVTYGNGKFVCVGNDGSSYYSTDGLTWNVMSGLDNGRFYCGVTYGNGRFVCVGTYGHSYYSTDGLTWTAMSGLNSSILYNSVTYGNDRFVTIGQYGSSYYSTDGITWNTMSGLNNGYHYNGVTYGNDRFVCVGNNGKSYYSTDGITWNAMSGLGNNGLGVTYGNGRFVCVSGSGYSAYSADGLTWNAMSGLSSSIIYSGVCSNDVPEE